MICLFFNDIYFNNTANGYFEKNNYANTRS